MESHQTELRGKRIALIGFGKENAALARFAATEGAASIVATDTRDANELQPLLAEVADLSIPFELHDKGNHPDAWADADVIFISPGITPGFSVKLPGIMAATERGAIISNHTQLLFERALAPIIGITGSAGKTTTTTLTGEILQAQGGRKVYVGGNMGVPLINEIAHMHPDDLIVLEISEVQLARLHASPHIGAILNIIPDHFDRYPSFSEYVRAKRQIVRNMRSQDYAVLNLDDPPSYGSRNETIAQTFFVSTSQVLDYGAWLADDAFWLRIPGQDAVRICGIEETRLPGSHNRANILFASLVSALAGATLETISQTIREFRGVSQRIEFVRELNGVRYYSDSIATTPNRMSAALHSFNEPILLILGGKDKDLPWSEGARDIVRRVRVATVLGASAPLILDALAQARNDVPSSEHVLERIEQVDSIEAATRVLAAEARPGEIVLLSPGCTSHDMFTNYQERGQRFIATVNAL
jgi:UDP-N-acetylmuramoylalanine--D-glutamate ligase